MARMKRTIALYAGALAATAVILNWLEYKFVTRVFATEFYVIAIAVAFAALGAWAGARLTRRPAAAPFQTNEAALRSLKITARERETLAALAEGLSNKEIARRFGVSPNTVKSQVSSLYAKLDASRRTEAVQRARDLALIP